jgi:hypothetical protein
MLSVFHASPVGTDADGVTTRSTLGTGETSD